MSEPDGSAPTLPGLEHGPEESTAGTTARGEAIATIAALRDESLLEPRHALDCQMLLIAAEATDIALAAARRTGKAYAVPLNVAQLLAVRQALPEPVAGDAAARFGEFVDKLLADERAV